MALGRIFISIAVSEGLAAPANSLMTTNSLHQAAWSAILAGQALTFLQLLGLIFSIVGVFSISYFDHLASKIVKQREMKKAREQEANTGPAETQ